MPAVAALFHEFFLYSYQYLASHACNRELFHVKFGVKRTYVIITIIT